MVLKKASSPDKTTLCPDAPQHSRGLEIEMILPTPTGPTKRRARDGSGSRGKKRHQQPAIHRYGGGPIEVFQPAYLLEAG